MHSTMARSNLPPVQTYIDQACRKLVQLELKVCSISHPDLTHSHILQLVQTLQSSQHTVATPRLRKLDLHDCPKLTSKSVVVLCDALTGTQVSHLSLQGVAIGREGIMALTRLLRSKCDTGGESRRLKWLDLEATLVTSSSDLWLGFNNDDNDTTQKVWEDFLSVACTSLDSLDLSRNGLLSMHIPALAKGLFHTHTDCCTLKALILSGNPIGNNGLHTICQALKQNRTLVLLACGECRFTAKGKSASSAVLSDCLRSNSTLHRLYLYGNGTGVTLTAPGNEEAHHWLELNSKGRFFLQGPECRPEFLPLILARSSTKSSLIYSLLREAPHLWISEGTSSSKC